MKPLARAVRHALRLGAGVAFATLAASASADTFPALFPLRGLYTGGGNDGFVLRGHFLHYWTNGVSGAGDVNHDGVDDFLLGGIRYSYVVYGRADGFPGIFDLASLLPPNGDGGAGFVVHQDGPYSAYAMTVSDAGDVNGDAIDDFVIGYPSSDRASGAFVVFGRDSGAGERFPPVLTLGDLLPDGGGDGSEGFALTYDDYCQHIGKSVSPGDVNGDGIADIIIGSPTADIGACYLGFGGNAYIIFGRDVQRDGNFPAEIDLATLLPENGGDGSTGVFVRGAEYGGQTGDAVSAGDVNGDGIDDAVIGAWYTGNYGSYGIGETFVVFGRNSAQDGGFPAEIALDDLYPGHGGDGSSGFVIRGDNGWDRTGYSVSIADVNGDGIEDVLIGALDVAESYVLFGRDTAQQGNFSALISLQTLRPPLGDGSAGFVMSGANVDLDRAAVSGAGDLNGDGVADLIVGAQNAAIGRNRPGAGFVVFGRDTAQVGDFPALFPLQVLMPPLGDGSAGFVAKGVRDGDDTGIAVGDAGDVNADGIDDVIIASIRDAYVVYGRDFGP